MGLKHPVVLLLVCLACSPPTGLCSAPEPAGVEFLPATQVKIADAFWSPILARNAAVTIPYILKKTEDTGVVENFAKAGGLMAGDFKGLRNSDEVLYEAIEAASYLLARQPDPKLDAYLDGLISKIAAAQEEDGYLLTSRTISLKRGYNPNAPGRWSDLGDDLELYMCGHLYEAALAHFQATGKKTLLQVATKNADLLLRLFGPNRRRDVCGHPNVEQALIRLYEVTGNVEYWRLARFFVDERGRSLSRQPRGPSSQDHKPVVYQEQAVGQAPRAAYLYAGVADIARTTQDPLYVKAVERLWMNIVSRKLYLNGGIGSREPNEGFGPDYELPNLTGLTEACAAVSFSMWNQRMFRLTGEGKYLDTLERTVYNNLLASVSLTGDQFFYACPMASDGKLKFNKGWIPAGSEQAPYADAAATRKPWFVSACCPPNVARYLEQIPGLIYGTRGPDVMVNLFIASQAEIGRNGAPLRIRQETRFPWEGKVRITLEPPRKERFRLLVRIPGWSRGQPVPGDLYIYLEPPEKPEVTVTAGGAPVPLIVDDGFLSIDREWGAGDLVEVNFTMPARRIVSNPAVKENSAKVALQRGPIVYCAEATDNRGVANTLVLQDDASLHAKFRPDLLGGVTTVLALGTSQSVTRNVDPKRRSAPMVTSRQTQLRALLAIPYYAWCNRGPNAMVVWIWREEQ